MFDSDVPNTEHLPETAPVVSAKPRRRMGQALVEYVLIVVLVSLAVVAVLTATGPAIGNVFSNVVYNLLGETTVPYATLNSSQFWNYVTAVAQYKPDVSALLTNTPVGYATNTPLPTQTGGPSPTATLTPTATITSTVGPSPTPVDLSYSIPFVDTADESPGSTKWHYQFTDAFAAAPWTVAFFNGATWNTNGNFGGSQPNATHLCTTNLASSTTCLSDVNATWGGSPDTGISASGGWWAQYIYNPAPFEGREYQVSFQLSPGDGVVLKVGGTSTYLAPATPPVGAYNQTITPIPFQVTAGANYKVEVDFYAAAGSSNHSVKMNFSTLADTGTCTWSTLSPGHSPNLSWQDANGGYYTVTSNCNLRLRGSIDLSGASSGSARLTFFDKWNIAANAVAQLGVRNYNFTSANDWTWVTVHNSGTQGLNWAYQYYDLSNFGTTNMNFMTGNKKIEIAFRVQNSDATVTAPGWFVDDITVEDNNINTYNIPVSDNMDTPSVLQWTPTCNWAVTTEQNYPSGFGHSWSASPNTTYSPNSDCSLYLNGVIDLTSYGPTNPTVPQLLFENQYYLTGSSTTLSVEYAPISNRNNWQALTPFGSVNPWVAYGTNTAAAWTLETFNLNQLTAGKYFFRFRFVSDSTVPTAAGWYIDNIQWRERPNQTVGIPFAEVFSNSDNWTMSDKWGLSTLSGGADGKPHQTDTYSLTDSPNGALYVIPSPLYTNTAQYTPQIIMSSASPGFNPVMQFWTHWDLATTGALFLEASTNGGVTFPTTLWTYSYGAASVSPFDTAVGNFNTNKAWTRYVVPLNKAYGGSMACGTSCANLTFRFRLTATSPAADGIYIDDLAVYDANIYNQSFTNSVACQATGICNPSPQMLASNPFSDSFETGLNNWYIGGDWAITTSTAHSGSRSFSATPNSTYPTPENAILEIAPTLDFTGVVQPVVSFWTKYAITTTHQISVEISKDGGGTWSSSQVTWITQPNVAQISYSNGTNLGWTRQLISLSSQTNPTKQIRIRFRLNALTTDAGSQGWWLDDVFVGELASLSGYNSHAMNYNETFGNLANVVAEGGWQSISDWGPYDYTFPGDNFQPVNNDYGNGQLNPLWDANYYHYYSTDASFPVSGNASWALPISTQMCGSAPLYGSQISDYTAIYSATAANLSSNTGVPAFTLTNATPTANYTADTQGVKFSKNNNGNAGFSFSVASGVAVRTLTVYVGVLSKSGSATASNFTAQLATSSGALYGTPYTESTLTTSSKTVVTSRAYTLVYNGTADGQLLKVQFTNNNSTAGYVILEGASVTIGSTGGGALLTGSFVAAPASVNFATTLDDYAHWGGDTGTEFDHKIQPVCIKPLYHQQEAVISHTWDATHIPVNAGGNAQWTTNALDNEYFVATYTRKYTVTKSNTYRFWSQADDGVRFLVDGIRVQPTSGGTALSYPWVSAGSNDWVTPSSTPQSYFYAPSLSAGVHTLEVDYFQKTGTATLQFQGSEQTSMLHSSAKGSNYSTNQDTGAYTSGYIAVQPSTTQTTTLSFYERYAVGSTSSNSDPMYVAISTDGGFNWIKLNGYGTSAYDITTTTGTVVPYTFNLGDSASNVDPFTTYQNWQLHSINLSNLLVNASPPYSVTGTVSPATGTGTALISTTAVTNILIKFELNTKASTTQGDGWYITNLNVVQN